MKTHMLVPLDIPGFFFFLSTSKDSTDRLLLLHISVLTLIRLDNNHKKANSNTVSRCPNQE